MQRMSIAGKPVTLRHMFKLDPNKSISDEHLEYLAKSGTDGFIVGGTDGVTSENVAQLYERLKWFDLPICYEVIAADAFVLGFDLYLIPIVLNTTELDWLGGKHQKALETLGGYLSFIPHETLPYIVLHKDCKVAKLTRARTELTNQELVSYQQLSKYIYHLPLLYLEYSGKYGNVWQVKEISRVSKDVHIFYGGGIRTRQQALEMAKYVDTVVVGNVIYEDIEIALQTVCTKNG